MSRKFKLIKESDAVLRRLRHGAPTTCHNRRREMRQFVNELVKLEIAPPTLAALKPEHIEKAVAHWQTKKLSPRTVNNKLATLRLFYKTSGYDVSIPDNIYYDLKPSNQTEFEPKAEETDALLNKVEHSLTRTILAFQLYFGLRREECLKIIPSLADRGDHLWLKGSWTKGKVERIVPIRAQEHREALDAARKFAGKGNSLIPEDKTYIQQRHVYNRQTREIGYKNLHGLRHAYAQMRYKELCQAKSSLSVRQLDIIARRMVSTELGHSRINVTNIYLY